MNVTNFTNDLAMSEEPEVVQAVKAACREYFRDELLNIHKAHKQNDKLGADYTLEFPGYRHQALDVKIRRQDFSLPCHGGDNRTACLELVANTTNGKIGWSLDPNKITDWVLFYYIESGRWDIYNARELRAAVIRYLPRFRKIGKPETQQTGRYESTSLFVSHRDLSAAIYRNSHRSMAKNNDKALAA